MASWQGTDYNERLINGVHNMLVAVQLHGVQGVSAPVPGQEHQLVSAADADRYITKGRIAYAKLVDQKPMRSVKAWHDRKVKELDSLIDKAVAVREGRRPQKMTAADYGTLRRSLGLSHSTMKTAASAGAERPLNEKLQQAAKWIRRELTKRADGNHPSHLAAKVLEEADKKFNLGSFGVEGASSPTGSRGLVYLNYGDPYDSTIVIQSTRAGARVSVALGGWAPYAGSYS